MTLTIANTFWLGILSNFQLGPLERKTNNDILSFKLQNIAMHEILTTPKALNCYATYIYDHLISIDRRDQLRGGGVVKSVNQIMQSHI